MKKVLFVVFVIFFLVSCVTNESNIAVTPYPIPAASDAEMAKLVGQYNSLISQYAKTADPTINDYNKINKANSNWMIGELCVGVIGSGLSGAFALASLDSSAIALPISISTLVISCSSNIRNETVSKKTTKLYTDISSVKNQISIYKSRFKIIMNSYLSNDNTKQASAKQDLVMLINDLTLQ